MASKQPHGRPGPVLIIGIPAVLAAVAAFFAFQRYQSNAAKEAEPAKEKPAEVATGPVTIRVAGDPWSGYSTFRGEPRLAGALAKDAITLQYLDEEKYYDQNERMKALADGSIDLAVTTLDAFLQHGAKNKRDGNFPGTVIFGIDESSGGDAIFLAKGRTGFDDVKATDKVCYAAGTPSEHLWDFASLSFTRLADVSSQSLGVVAADCWKKMEAGEVQVGVLWQPFTAIAQKAGYPKVFATGGQADDVILDIAVVNRDFAKKRPDAVHKLASAYFRTIDAYQKDKDAHGVFITKDCGPDCAGDATLGAAVLSGIDFLTLEENLCIWAGHCGAPGKLAGRVGKTGKLLVAKGKLKADEIPDAKAIIDDSILLALKAEREAQARLAAEVSGPDTQAQMPTFTLEQQNYQYTVPGAEASPEANVGTLTLPSVPFPEASYQLDDTARGVIAGIADRLRSFPALCIRVAGHTNSKGQAAANRTLSRLRAMVIAQELTRLDPKAFPNQRFDVRGMGAAQPILVNGVEDVNASRRTEFTLFNCGAGGA